MEILTGEKILFKCDHILGTTKSLFYNPDVRDNKDNIHSKCKFLMTNKIELDNKRLDNKRLVYLCGDILYSSNGLGILISNLKLLKNKFVLITHNSDYNHGKELLKIFEQVPNLEKIYCQNMNIVNEKILPLPIGLANSQWKHGNEVVFKEVYNKKIEKSNDIYFYFKVKTNNVRRNECLNALEGKIKWSLQKNNIKRYFEYLKSHKYCISPVGRGIDCHRFWECIYLNVIPICKRNILVEYYAKYFNIVIVDDWNDVNVKDLLDNYKGCNNDKNLLSFNNLTHNVFNNN